MAPHDVSKDGCIQMKEVSFMTVPLLTIPSWAAIFSAEYRKFYIWEIRTLCKAVELDNTFEVLTFPFSSILVTRISFYLGQSIFILIL